jgi:hypothetical protein
MAFIFRLLQVALMIVGAGAGLVVMMLVISWTIIGVSELLGWNNTMFITWLKSKLHKRKKRK